MNNERGIRLVVRKKLYAELILEGNHLLLLRTAACLLIFFFPLRSFLRADGEAGRPRMSSGTEDKNKGGAGF